jgi:hypothetical protein
MIVLLVVGIRAVKAIYSQSINVYLPHTVDLEAHQAMCSYLCQPCGILCTTIWTMCTLGVTIKSLNGVDGIPAQAKRRQYCMPKSLPLC